MLNFEIERKRALALPDDIRQLQLDFLDKAENETKIHALKAEIVKIKEDIEQVILAKMERDDFNQKQKRMGEIICELRILEGKKQST